VQEGVNSRPQPVDKISGILYQNFSVGPELNKGKCFSGTDRTRSLSVVWKGLQCQYNLSYRAEEVL
jgi:hypothetical protein